MIVDADGSRSEPTGAVARTHAWVRRRVRATHIRLLPAKVFSRPRKAIVCRLRVPRNRRRQAFDDKI
ncbi:hypothetical protein WT60_19740 [Burkholderia sp. MSMB617WGS]|nr:hypothetical protein WT60_19740 [Burkholderia sp. MSMB617WGS]